MHCRNNQLSCSPITIIMKKILTETNLAAVLFVLVMIVFSLAHEDSKKRDIHYTVSTSPQGTSASVVLEDVKQESSAIQQ